MSFPRYMGKTINLFDFKGIQKLINIILNSLVGVSFLLSYFFVLFSKICLHFLAKESILLVVDEASHKA